MTTPPVFVSLKEACFLLECSRRTIRRYRQAGRVRWRWHVNGRWREYLRDDCARPHAAVFSGEQSHRSTM